MNNNARTMAALTLGALAMMASLAGTAQNYPTRAVRVVLPFAAGGGTDLLSRLLCQRYAEVLGQPVLVDNRPGAGGNVGAEIVAKSLPDGHTLLFSTTSTAVNATLYPKLPFDIRKDFIAITQFARSPIVVAVHPSLPVRNVRELVALSKKAKGGLNYGSNGSGTSSHLAAVMLEQVSGIQLTHIPYKGANPAVAALLSGEVMLEFQATTSVLPFVRAGKLRAIAVTTERKVAALPDVPTVASDYPGFNVDQWYIVFAPLGTPSPIITRLHTEAVKALQHPDVKGWMQRENSEPVGSSPAEAAAFLAAEVEKYAKIVKISGAKPDQ
jgi:tripartite-type tricarboxylate transporter receptor subunit TctC